MPGRRKAAAGPPPLTDADVAALRARLDGGDNPRVVVRAGSAGLPAGTRGSIVRIGNPSDGEYVVVRLGKDEVPFSPAELALSARGARTVAAAAPAPKPVATPRARKAARTREPAQAVTPEKTQPATPPARSRAASSRSRGSAAATAARTRTRRSLPPLVVTLRFGDGSWTVEATRGARRVARATPVRPGAVKAFADLVDDPTVRDALTETVDSCRSVVEERAAALRAELQAAEAALKEYDAGRR